MITAYFNPDDAEIWLDRLTQWDFGQVLKICGLCILGDTVEVHFSDGRRNALRVIGKVQDGEIAVRIPDILLQTGRSLTAYVYLTNSMEGKTIRTVHLKVQPRAKPEDYEAPAERNALQQVLEIAKGRADGLLLDGNKLQLTAGEKPIGDSVELPAGEGGGIMEPLTEQEIDDIMKGETYVKLFG